VIEAMGRVKELGLTPDETNAALSLVNWGRDDGAA